MLQCVVVLKPPTPLTRLERGTDFLLHAAAVFLVGHDEAVADGGGLVELAGNFLFGEAP